MCVMDQVCETFHLDLLYLCRNAFVTYLCCLWEASIFVRFRISRQCHIILNILHRRALGITQSLKVQTIISILNVLTRAYVPYFFLYNFPYIQNTFVCFLYLCRHRICLLFIKTSQTLQNIRITYSIKLTVKMPFFVSNMSPPELA